MLDVYVRETSVRSLLAVANRWGPSRPKIKRQRSALDAEVIRVRDEIESLVNRNVFNVRKELTYQSEEDLLVHGERAADFFILDLAEHFRRYDVRRFPRFDGVRYVSTVRQAALVYKRASGHVTGNFAETMCPWVLKRLGISDGTFLRFKALSPGVLGRLMPDLLIPVAGQDVPCEVKHYADEARIRWDSVATAVTQVVAAMLVLPAQEGYIFAAIGHPDPTHRYRIEVIRLAA